jgi:hypothetical protein
LPYRALIVSIQSAMAGAVKACVLVPTSALASLAGTDPYVNISVSGRKNFFILYKPRSWFLILFEKFSFPCLVVKRTDAISLEFYFFLFLSFSSSPS